MSDLENQSGDEGLADLAIDPDVLERELAAELLGDPLDEIACEESEDEALLAAREGDAGLKWLLGGHEDRLQGL